MDFLLFQGFVRRLLSDTLKHALFTKGSSWGELLSDKSELRELGYGMNKLHQRLLDIDKSVLFPETLFPDWSYPHAVLYDHIASGTAREEPILFPETFFSDWCCLQSLLRDVLFETGDLLDDINAKVSGSQNKISDFFYLQVQLHLHCSKLDSVARKFWLLTREAPLPSSSFTSTWKSESYWSAKKKGLEKIKRNMIKALLGETSETNISVIGMELINKINGLKKIKGNMIKALLGETTETISVVGMEGISKTTLTTLALCISNDDRVMKNFDNIIRVTVSYGSDLREIAIAIYQSLEGLNHDLDFQAHAPLKHLLERIRERLLKRKCLLVLDGVRMYHDGDDWRALKALFRHGKSGSRILATTHETLVAAVMESSHVFYLQNVLYWIKKKFVSAFCWTDD